MDIHITRLEERYGQNYLLLQSMSLVRGFYLGTLMPFYMLMIRLVVHHKVVSLVYIFNGLLMHMA
ncbi:Uncharacterized protein TCM_015966 [Theobroma cacao]|uniref:Uncharacterized protein n=1 Tax=Theobroma cacao TaxID=3641 RepID=A0A061G4L3_THECC|nr:Uncharacterized protein TCM_015966 [Theobroma cacao]